MNEIISLIDHHLKLINYEIVIINDGNFFDIIKSDRVIKKS